jgi:hypothetical protein
LGVNRWHLLSPVDIHNDDVDFFKQWEPSECPDHIHTVPEAEFIEFSTEVRTTFTHQDCSGDGANCSCARTHVMSIEMRLFDYEDGQLRKRVEN